MPLFYQAKGFPKSIIGVFSFLPNICCVIFGPIISARADKTKTHSQTMIFSILIGVLTTTCMLFLSSTWIMAVFILAGSVVRSPLTSLFDSLVISHVGSNNFGNYRLFGAASFGIFSLTGGILLSSPSGDAGASPTVFAPIFFLNSVFCCISAMLCLRIERRGLGAEGKMTEGASDGYGVVDTVSRHDTDTDNLSNDPSSLPTPTPASAPAPAPAPTPTPTPSPALTEGVGLLILKRFKKLWVAILFFTLVTLISGVSDGIIDAFLFIRIKELGGSSILCGVGRFITCGSEVIVFRVAGTIYSKLGVWWCLVVTQTAFVIRFAGYLFLTRKFVWAVVFLESLNGFTFALTWQASCSYAGEISPKGAESTMQSLLESVHWGAGSGLGALGAGFIYHIFGPQILFSIAALLCVLSLIISICGAILLKKSVDDDETIGSDNISNLSEISGSTTKTKFSIINDDEEEEGDVEISTFNPIK